MNWSDDHFKPEWKPHTMDVSLWTGKDMVKYINQGRFYSNDMTHILRNVIGRLIDNGVITPEDLRSTHE